MTVKTVVLPGWKLVLYHQFLMNYVCCMYPYCGLYICQVLLVEGTRRESDVLFASVDWDIHKGENLALQLQVLVGNICGFTFTRRIFFVTAFLWSFIVRVCCDVNRCECDQV